MQVVLKIPPRHDGFTLVEIMIVVGIISLLCAMAVPFYARARGASQKSVCINNLRQIDGAIHQYALENKQSGGAAVSEVDVLPYLKIGPPVICPAGGTTFDDSYLLVDCETAPECKKKGAEHILE